ncbi:MAG: 50S ribosomal protein L13 [Candidatus Woesearchaeota archaeon]
MIIKMIIDATDLILGRMATVVAKKALLGETISIINCEKAVVSGKRDVVLAKYIRFRAMGTHVKGPFWPRIPDRLVRRAIRGMLPHKLPKGKEAFKRIMCYKGVPPEFEGKKAETIKAANASKIPNYRYLSVGEICKVLGAKI